LKPIEKIKNYLENAPVGDALFLSEITLSLFNDFNWNAIRDNEPIILFTLESKSWFWRGWIGLSAWDFVSMKTGIITVNHEWLHFILWKEFKLEPKVWDWLLKKHKLYPLKGEMMVLTDDHKHEELK